MLFTTRNSVYEMDNHAPRVRRVSGANEPLIGPDGEWREFQEAFIPGIGSSATFYFSDGTFLRTSTVQTWGSDDGSD